MTVRIHMSINLCFARLWRELFLMLCSRVSPKVIIPHCSIVNYDTNFPTIRKYFNESYLADLGIINPDKMRAMIEQCATGRDFPMWTFEMIVYAEWWVRGLDDKDLNTAQIPARPSNHCSIETAASAKADTDYSEILSRRY